MKRRRIAIVGAGGFAREVEWLLREIDPTGSQYDFVGYVVSDLAKLGEYDSRDEVRGELDWLHAPDGARVDALALGIGTPASRLRVADAVKKILPDVEWPSLVHPNVRFDAKSCRFEEGTLLCAGVVATVRVHMEAFAMANLACTLGHEARLGRGAVLNPTVNLSGGVTLGEGVLVGTGAQILQYLNVGDRAVVGAGSVVTRDVPPGVTVVGVPARPRA